VLFKTDVATKTFLSVHECHHSKYLQQYIMKSIPYSKDMQCKTKTKSESWPWCRFTGCLPCLPGQSHYVMLT